MIGAAIRLELCDPTAATPSFHGGLSLRRARIVNYADGVYASLSDRYWTQVINFRPVM
jgi:hypothetical protein